MGKNTIIDLLSLLMTLAVYYFLDMGADLRLALEFYNEGHYLRFWLIIGISGFAMYSLNAVACYWESRDYGLTWGSCIFYILPYGLLYQRIRCLALLLPIVFYKDFEIKGYDIEYLLLREDWKAVVLALIQVYASNGIHIVWQMHSVLHEAIQLDSIQFWTKSSIVVSIISCSLALSDYHLVRRNVLGVEKYGQYALLAVFLTHVSTFCVLIARFISIALLLTSRLYYIFIVIIVIHWTASLVALIKCDFNLFHDIEMEKESDGSSSSAKIRTVQFSDTKFCALAGSFIFSLLLLVTHLETRHKRKIILIHLFENIIFLLSWYFTTSLENTWHLWFLIGALVLNVVGVVTCLLLWKIFLKEKNVAATVETEAAIEMLPAINANSA